MKLAWSSWNIAAKILIPFLGLSIATMAVIGYVAISNIRSVGDHALDRSTALGKTAIDDSTEALTRLGEDMIRQIAGDVARQVEMYLGARPPMSLSEMRADEALRRIAIQPVGVTGYTTILDPGNSLIVIHKYLEQEKDISGLQDELPSFWRLLNSYQGGQTSGYYQWREIDGTVTQKYASIVPIHAQGAGPLTLWATTYIEEFSRPSLETEQDINAAIASSREFIYRNVNETRDAFVAVFAALIIIVVSLSLLISWFITTPVFALRRGAEAIAEGNLDYKLTIRNKDELGGLAAAFNQMSGALRSSMEELQRSGQANIAKEREIQDNLRLYAQKVSQAQEEERKRIARELHDDTVQSLVVISRQLEDLGTPASQVTPESIRRRIHEVIEGVRHFSQQLRPSILDDLGLVPAINALCADLTRDTGIPVDLEIKGTPAQMKPEKELMLFRIAQEALTNIGKHSGATRSRVSLVFGEGQAKLTIDDNGSGFDVPLEFDGLTGQGKLGLVGMKERVQLLNGTIAISSHAGSGTQLHIEVPLD